MNNPHWKNDVVKAVRTETISQYLRDAGYRGAVIFSCGTASGMLKAYEDKSQAPRLILDISPTGPLTANKWFMPGTIKQVWPDLFDATPGHLPLWMYVQICEELRKPKYRWIGERILTNEHLQAQYGPILTGSGETIILFRWLFPALRFEAVQYEDDPATADVELSPLFPLIGGVKKIPKPEV